jgi:putative endonuclease
MRKRAFVYILRCADGSLYTGFTLDVIRRVKQHQGGRGGRYTRTRVPVELVYTERCTSRRTAMQRELAIKHLSRAAKLALIDRSNGTAMSRLESNE